MSQIQTLVNAVFGGGSPNANSAQGKVKNIAQQVSKGNILKAQEHAFDLVDFVLKKARDKRRPLPGTKAQLASLINTVFCFVGTTLTIGDPDNAWIVSPADQQQTLIASNGGAGTLLPPNSVSEPTLITADPIPNTFPPGSGPLTTRLDQYPGFYEFTNQSATSAPLLKPVVVAVCPTGAIPPAVLARMRLGHQRAAGFEITPPANASFLTCPTSTASTTRMSRWMRALASVITPKPLFARQDLELLRGGVGGTAGEFSPFAPIDPELSLRGGVGGTAGEFLRTPTTIELTRPASATPVLPGATRSMAPSAATCSPLERLVNARIDPECLPVVVLVTHIGTVMRSVPVGWTIATSGGRISPKVAGTCGVFGSTATTTTSAAGVAGICWVLGPVPGTNTVVAAPSVGGDAPVGVTFAPSSISFSATGRLP